jgi:hypothetical protein
MTAVSRLLLRLVVTAGLAALVAILGPVFVDRREYAVAVHNYVKHPTLDNGVVLAQEYAKTRRMVLITRLGTGGVLFVFMNLGWFLVTRRPAPDRGSVPLDV